jgi:hypothetical protein
MSGYRNKYLDMLKSREGKKGLPEEPSKSSKFNFEDFEGSHVGGFSEISPPLDAERVPCGGCPSCNQGQFWRWPKFHPQHNPRGWFCSPPPHGSGPCDFCGVPDQMLAGSGGSDGFQRP